ncbi:MAG: hypothetical protein ACJ76H_16330 [Bacteriovoracaceae bacterium]
MKTTLLAVLACLSFSALADSLIDARLERLQRASQNGEIDRLSYQEKAILKIGLDQAISVLRSDDRPAPRPTPDYRPTPNPIPNGNGDWRRNSSYDRNDVAVYSDDRCGVKITDISARENCDRLSVIFGQQRAWSVSINGQCIDINDTTFGDICSEASNLARAQKPRTEDLVAYSDDRCSTRVAVIDPGVDCNALGAVLSQSRVWSVSVNGQCVDIQDEYFDANTCNSFQNGVLADYDNSGNRRRGDTVEMFSDDRCGTPVYSVKRGADCQALNGIFNNQRIWSVRFRGQCVDINDTTFLPACQSYAQ